VIVAIIPARGGSKGIPRKNIIPVAGKPLVAWSIEQARHSELVEKVFVSTDDNEIADISRRYGADVVERPAELSSDTASSEDALTHAIDTIERGMTTAIETVVFLQATSPVRGKEDINNAIRLFRDEKADSLFSCMKLEDYFIWEKNDNRYVSVNYDYRNRKRRQDIKPQYLENGSIYVFPPVTLRKHHNRLAGKIVAYEMDHWKSFQIDDKEDVEICEYYLRNKIAKEGASHVN